MVAWVALVAEVGSKEREMAPAVAVYAAVVCAVVV